MPLIGFSHTDVSRRALGEDSRSVWVAKHNGALYDFPLPSTYFSIKRNQLARQLPLGKLAAVIDCICHEARKDDL